jgi:hypothetical protein
MSSLAIALVVLACVLAAAVLGFWLRAVLPGHHLNAESKNSLTAAIGVIGTLTALVFGLLIATAKSSYDAKSDGITQVMTDIILLDRVLAQYGADAAPVRAMLRESATRRLKALWGESGLRRSMVDAGAGTAVVGTMERRLRELKPENDQQRALQKQALDLTTHVTRTLLLTVAQAEGSIPTAFLVVVTGWMIIMFAGLGVLAPRNATALTGVMACAFAFSAALFLILELDTPYGGVIEISDAPVRLVLEQLGK